MAQQIPHRRLGQTDLTISRLGIGLAEIGFQLSAADVEHAREVLDLALDLGITFLDTAGCYGVAEEMIGAALSGRREEFVLASKTGHMSGACGDDSWSYECVGASIDRSLARMRTDRIDLMQLHSCDVATLERGDAIRALEDARTAGKIRWLGYSGDNDAVLHAARSGRFHVIQTSFNLVDQRPRYALLDEIRERGLGLIAKRPILNGVWRAARDPDPYHNGYASEYFRRQQELTQGEGAFPAEPTDPILASLGFTLSHEEVTVAIVGSRNPDHVRSNVRMLSELPLPDAFIQAAHDRFDAAGRDWEQRT